MVYPSLNTASLRRSASVSQSYKSSSSRRRISTSSQASSASSALGMGIVAPMSASALSGSPPAGQAVALSGVSASAKKLPSATAVAAAGTSVSGSPSPLRRETSLLSISRDPLTSTDAPSSNGGGSGSPTPRPNRYASSTSSTGTGSQSGDSPTEYKFPLNSINTSPAKATVAQPKISPTSTMSRWSGTGASFITTVRQGSTGLSGYAASTSPSSSVSATSPPRASPLAISASSPGLQQQPSMGLSQSASFSRLPSLSVSSGANRSSHGRSESVSSMLGSSPASGMSSSPSTSFRTFPSAPPSAPWGTQPASSPGSAGSSSSMPSGPAVAGQGAGTSAGPTMSPTSSKTEAGGIRLQRVPTSVRLAQDLHPMSPAASERRRSSVDAAMALATTSGNTSGHAAFSLGTASDRKGKGSSGSSSETERRDREELDKPLRAILPATPMATRRNTPSPRHMSDAEVEVETSRDSLSMSSHLRSPSQSRLLASPFISGEGLSGASGTSLPQGLALSTPPLGGSGGSSGGSSAFAPLFPFSVPSTSNKPALSQPLSPGARSRSHSRTRSKGSPLLDRISPRLAQDPFSAPPVSPSASRKPDDAVSPRTMSFPVEARAGNGLTESARKRQTISAMNMPTLASSSGHSRAPTSPEVSTKIQQEDAFAATPRTTRKQFRTSMMPGSTAVSSTEDYARHLHESRASKLRKWANNPNTTVMTASTDAGHTIGPSSIVPSSAKSKRRAGIPDFDTFGYSATGYGEDASGDVGTSLARPGTSGSKEIAWVDWLEEYKMMKEAKIRAEEEARMRTEAEQQQDLELGEEADVATEMDKKAPSSLHSRKRSDDSANASLSNSASRRGSDEATTSKGEISCYRDVCLSSRLLQQCLSQFQHRDRRPNRHWLMHLCQRVHDGSVQHQ